jgi:hypothetical protein
VTEYFWVDSTESKYVSGKYFVDTTWIKKRCSTLVCEKVDPNWRDSLGILGNSVVADSIYIYPYSPPVEIYFTLPADPPPPKCDTVFIKNGYGWLERDGYDCGKWHKIIRGNNGLDEVVYGFRCVRCGE